MADLHVSFAKIIDGPDFRVKTCRCTNVRDSATQVLQWMSTFPLESQKFEKQLIDKLKPLWKIIQSKSSFSEKEKMWKEFHSLRLSEDLLSIWSNFLYPQILRTPADPIMIQFVTQDIFERYIQSPAQSPSTEQAIVEKPTNEELNALRYAAGYVLRSVTSKYKGTKKSSRDEVLGALGEMEADICDDDDDNDDDKATEWVTKLDRGRLVKVSDVFYSLILAIEMKVRMWFNKTTLSEVSKTTSQVLPKNELISASLQDHDVQFYWCLMTVDLTEEVSQELLCEIIQLWVTIRGFSFTNSWLEMYRTNKAPKSKGLRKELKRQS